MPFLLIGALVLAVGAMVATAGPTAENPLRKKVSGLTGSIRGSGGSVVLPPNRQGFDIGGFAYPNQTLGGGGDPHSPLAAPSGSFGGGAFSPGQVAPDWFFTPAPDAMSGAPSTTPTPVDSIIALDPASSVALAPPPLFVADMTTPATTPQTPVAPALAPSPTYSPSGPALDPGPVSTAAPVTTYSTPIYEPAIVATGLKAPGGGLAYPYTEPPVVASSIKTPGGGLAYPSDPYAGLVKNAAGQWVTPEQLTSGYAAPTNTLTSGNPGEASWFAPTPPPYFSPAPPPVATGGGGGGSLNPV